MHKPKLIIFDWDNTLVDSWPNMTRNINYALQAFDMPTWSIDEVKQRVHKSCRDLFPDIFGDNWEKARNIFYEGVANSNHLATPLSGALETLSHLAAIPLKMCVISNKKGEYLRKEISGLNWNNFFTHIIGSADLEKDKPDPAPVFHCMQQLGITDPKQVWFVGDTEVDIQCALNADCTPIAINARNELENCLNLAGHNELLNLIKDVLK